MTRLLLTAILASLAGMPFLSLALAASDSDDLAQALKKAGGWESYRFTAEEQPGPGTGGALEGGYQKGKPLSFKADRIEFFKKGEAIAYLDSDRWLRSRTGTLSDPLRVLGALAKVNAARLPHEEATSLAKAVGAVKKEKAKDGGHAVYSAELNAESARSLARSEHRGVAQSGSARFWIDGDGKLVKYTVTIKLQGRIGGADVDGTVVKNVSVSGIGSTRVTVPEGASKALE
jgi:hypothetical protein